MSLPLEGLTIIDMTRLRQDRCDDAPVDYGADVSRSKTQAPRLHAQLSADGCAQRRQAVNAGSKR